MAERRNAVPQVVVKLNVVLAAALQAVNLDAAPAAVLQEVNLRVVLKEDPRVVNNLVVKDADLLDQPKNQSVALLPNLEVNEDVVLLERNLSVLLPVKDPRNVAPLPENKVADVAVVKDLPIPGKRR